jgi:hypothetical protein
MFAEVLTPDQLAVLSALTPVASLREFYLAGDTALGLRHGHRRSIDFDWFRQDAFDDRALLRSLERQFDRVEVLQASEETVYVRLMGITASFFRLPYALLQPVEPTPWGFGLASDEDIAAMKLEAVAGRGSRKDFIDLYVLCAAGLRLERVQYGVGRNEAYHRVRALSFFDDAEREPMPDMLTALDWGEVRSFFEREAARLLARGIGD